MLNNDRVQMFNERIQGMCSEKQVYFVNGFEALAVNGSLPDDASPTACICSRATATSSPITC